MAEKIPKAELDQVKKRFTDDLALIHRYFEAKESFVVYNLAFTLRRHPDVIPSLIQIVRKIQTEGTPANKGDGLAYAKSIALAALGTTKQSSRVRDVFNKFGFRHLILPVEPAYRKKKQKKPEQEAEIQPGLTEPAEQLMKVGAEPKAETLADPKELSALNALGEILIKYPIYVITPESFDIILADRLQRMKEKLCVIADTRTMQTIDFLIDQLKKGS